MQRMPMCLVWPSKYRYLNVGTVVLPVPTTWTSISLSTCGTCHCHSDRMAWLFVQYSANEKFSNFMQNKPSKLPKTFSNFAKVVKFRQIWSRWSLSDHCASATWTCNENKIPYLATAVSNFKLIDSYNWYILDIIDTSVLSNGISWKSKITLTTFNACWGTSRARWCEHVCACVCACVWVSRWGQKEKERERERLYTGQSG